MLLGIRLWLILLVVRTALARLPKGADLMIPPLDSRSRRLATQCWHSPNVNAVLRRQQLARNSQALLSHGILTNRGFGRLLVQRRLLDFFDPLEPLEMVWELYVHRYEIMDEMVARASQFARRKSIRAGVYFVAALGAAEIFARLGVLGGRKRSLVGALRQTPRRVNEGVEERLYQKTSSWMVDHAVHFFSRFRGMGNKSKFAISVSAGGLFGQLLIRTTVLAVKTVLISFFVLETASFLGVIGEPGESILDWVDDQYKNHAAWTVRVARLHKEARKTMNLEVLENLYEACVDEEKIASFGFSLGTVFALLT